MGKKNRKYKDYHKTIDGIEYKQCRDCLEWLVMNNDNFGTDNGNKDKYNMLCIKCLRIYGNTMYMKDRENRIKKSTTYQSEHKKERVKWTKTYYQKEHVQETHRLNRLEQKESGYYDNYIKNNPDKVKLYTQNHRQHDITELEWMSCLKVFNNTCAYCGIPIEKHVAQRKGKYFIMQFHKEHVDDYGYNDIRNCVPSCRDCNSHKHQYNMEEWFRKQKFFSEDKLEFIKWWITEGYKNYIEDKPLYRIVRKQNEGLKTFHWELWTVDEMRNMVELIDVGDQKKDLNLELIDNT